MGVACGMLVGHSLLSPLLFVCAFELYVLTGSRSFICGHSSSASAGLLLAISLCAGLNFGLPPFLNFWVEVSLFSVLGSVCLSALIPLMLPAFLSFLFSIFFLCAYVWWPTRILVSGASFSLRFPSSHHSFSANTTWLTESVIIDMLMLYTFFICLLLLVLQYGCVRLTLGVGQSLVLRYDSSSYLFLFTLLFISVGVLTWSYYYMDSEVMYRRFASLIFLFLCSIFLLVFSADLLSLFVAWDLLGFTSFFLSHFFSVSCFPWWWCSHFPCKSNWGCASSFCFRNGVLRF